MTKPAMAVRPITEREVPTAAGVLARAFADNPLFGFILDGRDDIESRLVHLFADAAVAELRKPSHLVEMAGSGNAVALWREVDDWKLSPLAIVRSSPSAERAFGTRLPRTLRVLTAIEKVHPTEPHRPLVYIGTHKNHGGKGLGGALMRSMLERCDRDGIATYLESTNPANDAWYARFGYESRGPIPLPKGAPVVTAMWRDPQPPQSKEETR